jgi:DNA polymerase III epsilon subunit-like protein
MKASNIVVFDLESGGFLTKDHKHGIVEIAAIALDVVTLKEIGRYEAIVQPYKNKEGAMIEYSDSAYKVHGIKVEKMETDGVPLKEALLGFAQLATKAKRGSKKPVMAGHNISKFDIPFLIEMGFDVAGMDLYKSFDKHLIDSMEWAVWKWPDDTKDITDHKLATCVDKIGEELIDAHRAMTDVEANVKLVISMLKSLRGAGEENVDTSKNPKKYRDSFLIQ